jgi:hypothetical protein
LKFVRIEAMELLSYFYQRAAYSNTSASAYNCASATNNGTIVDYFAILHERATQRQEAQQQLNQEYVQQQQQPRRTRFTTWQLTVLRDFYAAAPHWSMETRKLLAAHLHLSESSVRYWQAHQRARVRRCHKTTSQGYRYARAKHGELLSNPLLLLTACASLLDKNIE